MPFQGISYESRGSDAGAIIIMLGTEADDHLERRSPNPSAVNSSLPGKPGRPSWKLWPTASRRAAAPAPADRPARPVTHENLHQRPATPVKQVFTAAAASPKTPCASGRSARWTNSTPPSASP